MKRPLGTVQTAAPQIQGQHLKVVASLRMDEGELREAQLPDREMAVMLPRCVLVAGAARAPVSLLDTMRPIVERMCLGRRARTWQYKDRWFFSFQPWKGVRFVEDPPAAAGAEAAPTSP
jgi:hypothetical protein